MSKRVTRGSVKKQLEAKNEEMDVETVATIIALQEDIADLKEQLAVSRARLESNIRRPLAKKQEIKEPEPEIVANNAALDVAVAKFKKAVAESRVKKPSVNYKVVDVKGDGNCFFRAIYKSAKYSGNLEKLINCFLDKPLSHYEANELDFIVDMREKIAKSIEEDNDNNIVSEMYKYLNDFATNDDLKKEDLQETYKAVLESLPEWMSKRFKKPPTDYKKFKQNFCKYIRRPGTYVSHIEIEIFKYLNDTFCSTPDKHVILNIFNTPPKENIDISAINILNKFEIHYNYLRANETIGRRSPKSPSFSSQKSATSTSSSSPFEFLDTSSSSSSSNPSQESSSSKPSQESSSSSSKPSVLSSRKSSSSSSASPETKELLKKFSAHVNKLKLTEEKE